MAWTASLWKGVSFDEGLQLAAGYNGWLNNDHRIEGANGDFVRRWATLPYLVSRPRFVGQEDPLWKGAAGYELGYRFLFQLGNRPEALLQQGRAMVALLGVAAGLLVFCASREIFGPIGGLVSLTAFVFSPHMLAFGGVVSTDMSITLTLFGSTWLIWRLLHEVTWARVVCSLGCFGLLLLAKPTALVIFPITGVLFAIRFLAATPLILRWRGGVWTVVRKRWQVAVFGALILFHAIAGWSAIWTHYGWRFAASPNPADPTIIMPRQPYRDRVAPIFTAVLGGMERSQWLPQGFIKGVDSLLGNDDELGAFMEGEWHVGGRTLFFPYAVWVKTQPGVMLLLLLGLVRWIMMSIAARAASPNAKAQNAKGVSFYALSPYLVLIVCYMAVAMSEDLNIGHRHVLPIYPALYVLAGMAAMGWTIQRAMMKGAVVAALIAVAADSLMSRPDYLAYFGPQAGGSRAGYKHLVDSSLDWGMELPRLREWLKREDPAGRVPVYLAYFGTDSPRYHGIRARRLPSFPDWRFPLEHYLLGPGYYAISASLLQGVHTSAFGAWNETYEQRYRTSIQHIDTFAAAGSDRRKREELIRRKPPGFWENQFDLFDNLRFARLCAWLRHRGEPPHHIGHGIFIWRLSEDDLRAALLGPPPELSRSQAILRRFRPVGELTN